jgi:hypothetical protein
LLCDCFLFLSFSVWVFGWSTFPAGGSTMPQDEPLVFPGGLHFTRAVPTVASGFKPLDFAPFYSGGFSVALGLKPSVFPHFLLVVLPQDSNPWSFGGPHFLRAVSTVASGIKPLDFTTFSSGGSWSTFSSGGFHCCLGSQTFGLFHIFFGCQYCLEPNRRTKST